MNTDALHPEDSGEEASAELPVAMRAALRRLGPAAPPSELDRAVLAAAGSALARERGRRRRRTLLFAVPLAAAAAAALVLLARRQLAERSSLHEGTGGLVQAEDLDHNGRVDILDAFQLARELEQGHVLAQHDFSGDGRVDRADVDRLAQLAVRIGT